MLRQKFTVQVTTLPDCDDITGTRFDDSNQSLINSMFSYTINQLICGLISTGLP
jgi:hypothetical protein